LPTLYSAAEILAYPSLYEGLGLPVLEAMACGTPVVTSNVSSLPEVGGHAALLVNPLDADAISDALGRLLQDAELRQQLVARGFDQARRFTWEKAATQLIEIYELFGAT
jgi:glycosyltransferase involved in cell wall biosynthesis